jgi:energy-converting hydrogenase Eha subunit A
LPYQVLADAVLPLHFGVVVFVVLGLPAIVIGNRAGWSWATRFWWRLAHLVAIGVVALQAWLGQYCPLTILESWLRVQAGESGYTVSFIEHWVQSVLYYQAPLWVFASIYTAFGLAVAWAWWRYPPRVGKPKGSDA